ncbi:MAG TPA: translation elongation factor Ts [Longimicrobium sp.]|jgi:elongation factor Ts|uniref:translation elongation factor Ts n=1 Tax=Longimicrobium sp. TaxID=2029185 RepID=UPI002EDB8A5B
MSNAISAQAVKELRDRTAAGMMECKNALMESGGDMEAAIDILRARGAAKAAKRADREARDGVIGSYIHMGGKIGVLVEVNCETDFVAKTDAFQQLVRDVAMHIAAANPVAIRREDFPQELVERERGVYREQMRESGKPEKIWDKIVDGKLEKFFADQALLEQPFVKNPDQTVGQLITEVSGKTGEKIDVRRFTRYALGE